MAIQQDLEDFNEFISNVVISFGDSMNELQELAYNYLKSLLLEFDVENGRLTTGNLNKKLIQAEEELFKIFRKRTYTTSIKSFLEDLGTIQDRTIELHHTYNDFKQELSALSETGNAIYNQAKVAFGADAIAAQYIQPVKNLLARQAIGGVTIKQSLSLIDKWNNGDLASGRLNNGMPAPNLNRYATQMARDTAYSMNRNTNDLIAKELDLKAFRYVGNKVADSRPLCVHLVDARRAIKLDEMPALIAKYPEGLYPDTNKSNFMQKCGGYGCRHMALAVRG